MCVCVSPHQGLCLCLDFQFDTVVRDRPVILSKLLLLHSLKPEIPALSWEFFVNRFETLSLEAQLHLDCNKEFPFPTSECVETCQASIACVSISHVLISCVSHHCGEDERGQPERRRHVEDPPRSLRPQPAEERPLATGQRQGSDRVQTGFLTPGDAVQQTA